MSEKPTYEELEQQVQTLVAAESERAKTLEALQYKERLFGNLFRHMLHEVHIWELVFDDSGNIETWRLVDANPSALKSWNKNLPDIVGKTTDELFPHSNATELFMPIVKKMYSEGTPQIWEAYFPDTEQYLHMSSVSFGNHFISTGLDVSEAKRIEAALRRNNEILKRTESIAHVGSWDWDIATDTVFWSEELFRIFQLEPSGTAPNWAEQDTLYPPEDFEKLKQAVQTVIADSAPYDIELRAIRKDGEIRICSAKGFPETGEDGQVVRLFGFLQDITDRKRAEFDLIDLKKQEQALLDHSPVCHKIVDLNFNLQYMSKNGFNMLHLEPDAEVYDKPYPFYFFPEPFKKEMSASLLKVKETGEMLINEGLTQDSKGNAVWLKSTLIPVVGNGGIDYITVVSSDETERKQMEQELIRTQRLRAVGELSAGVSHNLNNILTGVLVPAHMLKLKLKTEDPELLQDLDDIVTYGERARDLVHRLHLSVRGVEDNKLESVSVNEIVQEAVQTTSPRWKDESESRGNDIRIEMQCESIPPIIGTKSRLHDILTNLIFNSIDAMPDGGTITIKTQLVDDRVRLTFADTGMGMDRETQLRIFEPFFTTKMDVGTGLGLSTVHNTIAQWRGTIEVESAPGEGTIFTVYLPISRKEVAQTSRERERYRDRMGRVLIVDDDQGVCSVLSRLLGKAHEVKVATDGKQALTEFAPNYYDVALIDLGMSGISGDQVAQQMRQRDPHLSTVLITGWVLDVEDPRRNPFDLEIKKPFDDIDEILYVVARAIALHDGRAEKVD